MQLALDQDFIRTIESIRSKIYYTAKRMLISKDEAEDATQDIILKLWEMDRNKAKNLKSIEAYSVTMVKNYCLDRLKSKHAQQQPLDDTIKFKPSIIDLDRVVEAKDKFRKIEILIEKLPIRERTALQLRDFEQLEFKNIAKKMNIPEGTVRVYLSRARKKLREEFLTLDQHGL